MRFPETGRETFGPFLGGEGGGRGFVFDASLLCSLSEDSFLQYLPSLAVSVCTIRLMLGLASEIL